jgi:hypothetical protein
MLNSFFVIIAAGHVMLKGKVMFPGCGLDEIGALSTGVLSNEAKN